MKDFSGIPDQSTLIKFVKDSDAKVYQLDDNKRATIPITEKPNTAIVDFGGEHFAYVTWSNESPIFGRRLYRLVAIVEVIGDTIKDYLRFVHGDEICITMNNNKQILLAWARPEDADILDARKSDDETVSQHFTNIYRQYAALKPREYARFILDFYDQTIVATWYDGLFLEVEEPEAADYDDDIIRP